MVAYSFKKQFIAPILVGIGVQVHHEPGAAHVYTPKRQTIRAIGKRRHARPGETIQLYTAMRTKQCRKLGEGICTSVSPIGIFLHGDRIKIGDRPDEVEDLKEIAALDVFARCDGFESWQEMKQFWVAEHGDFGMGPFVGVLIKWEAINGH